MFQQKCYVMCNKWFNANMQLSVNRNTALQVQVVLIDFVYQPVVCCFGQGYVLYAEKKLIYVYIFMLIIDFRISNWSHILSLLAVLVLGGNAVCSIKA